MKMKDVAIDQMNNFLQELDDLADSFEKDKKEKEMTIGEIKLMKIYVESTIQELLNLFQDKTKCEVKSIQILTSPVISVKVSEIYGITLNIGV
jgi:hypothetical protein